MTELVTNIPLLDPIDSPQVKGVHPKEAIEAGAYTAALERDESVSVLDQMRRVKDEVALTGDSVEAQRALLNAVMEENDESLNALNQFVRTASSTPDEILEAAESLRLQKTGPIDMATSFAKKNAQTDMSETAEEQEVQEQNVEFFRDIVKSEREMATVSRFYPYARDDIASRTGFVLDGAAVMIPFNFQAGVMEIKESLGLESSMWDLVFFGSALDDVRRHLEALLPEKQVAAMREVHKLLQDQGFTGTNEFIGYTLTEDLLIDPHGSYGREYVDNIIGVLDLIGVGQGLRGMFGGFKSLVTPRGDKTLTKKELPASIEEALGLRGMGEETSSAVLPRIDHANPIRIAIKTNPRTGQLDAAAIIADPTGQAAKEVGISKDVAINEWILPKAHIVKSPITAQPGGVTAEVLRIRSTLGKALDDVSTNARINYTEEELKSAGVQAMEAFGKLFDSTTNVPSSIIEFTDTGIQFSARFQANEVGGWTSVRNLNQYLDHVFAPGGGQLNNLRVWRKNPASGQWNDISKQMGLKQNQGKGDYSFTLDFKLDIDPSMKEAFGPDAISAGLGRATKYETNPLGMFSRSIVDGATIAKDKAAKLQHQLLNVITDTFKGVRKAAPDDWSPLMSAIRHGAKDEVWYDRTQLRLNFGIKSQKALNAYEAFKEVQDALFTVASQDAYKTLKREGYQSIYINKNYSGFNVKEIISGDTELIGKSVYVPSSERVLKIESKDHLDQLIDDGMQFGSLKSIFRQGDNEFRFVAIVPQEKAQVDILYHYPVPYRQGHYSRFYENGNWVVKVKNNPRRTVDGRHEAGGSEVVGIARTREEAMRLQEIIEGEERALVQSMGLEERFTKEFEHITGDLWHTGKADTDNEWEMIERSMLNMNRRRGEWLRGLEDLAAIDDPLEATAKQIGAVMDRATKRDWVDAQTATWVKTFSKTLYEDQPSKIGTWPNSTRELVDHVSNFKSKKPHMSDLANRAVAHYEYVEMVKGLPSKLDQWWRVLNLKMAEATGTGTKVWQGAAKVKVEEAAKTFAFKVLLGLNPMKHLQLQPSQILQLSMVEPKYIFSLTKNGMFREFLEMAHYSSSKAIGVDLEKQFPKGRELWDEFARTGLSDAVAHHVYLNPGNFSKRLKPDILAPGAANAARRAGSAAVNAPQKVGFEAGERANVMLHWLVARRRWMDRNPGKDWKGALARDQIHAEQRAISLNPNAAGKMGYQDWGTAMGGISSIFMQFFSHPHKTTMQMLPQALGGSRVFTAAEKAKIAGANFILFGTAFAPFMNDFLDMIAVEAEWDVDPDMWKTLKNGVTDVAFNRLLTMATGEEQDVRFSATFNPTTGVQAAWDNAYKFVMRDADFKPDLFASAAVYSKFQRALGTISTVWNQPETYSDEKLMQSLEQLAEIAPGWSQYIKGKIAINTGILTSAAGRRIGPVTNLEAVAKIMGWTVGTEKDYYDNLQELQRIVYDGTEKDLRDHAKQALNDYMDIYKTQDQEVTDTLLMMMTHMTIIHKDLRQRQIVMDEMVRQTEKALKTGEENLITIAIKASQNADREELIGFIMNAPEGDIPEEARNAFLLMLGARE